MADFAYFILGGEVAVNIQKKTGKAAQVATVGLNQVVGELAALSTEPRSATITALEDTQLLKLSIPYFREFIANVPSAMQSVRRLRDCRLRPIFRKDSSTLHTRLRYDGSKAPLLEHKETHDFVEIPDWGRDLLPLLDGHHALHGLVLALSSKHPDLNTSDISTTLQTLIEKKFVTVPTSSMKETTEGSKKSFSDKLTELLTYAYEFKETSKPLNTLYRRFGFIFFNWPAQIIM